MADFTAADVKRLRDATGAGMMDCKKALTEADGDYDKAVEFLRIKGAKDVGKRLERSTTNGVVVSKDGALLELDCETDFVAKNADFVAFAQSIVNLAVKGNLNTLDELLAAQLDGASVSDKINDQVARIGEKIQLARFERIDAEGVAAYIHGAYRMGVLVGLSTNSPAVLEAGKDIAMQIAAMNPVAVDPDSVPADVVAREKAIVTDQIKNDPKMAGKPDEMIDKIAVGKLNAFFKENTLTAQAFVKDASKTVGDYLKSVDSSAKVTQFKRVQLG